MTVKKTLTLFGILALVAALGLASVGSVFAQTATPDAQAAPDEQRPLLGKGFGCGLGSFGGQRTAAFDAVAKALNLTPTQLFEQLHSGKTLEEIAAAQGVDLQQVREAMQAVQTQTMRDRIAQAVEDGTITQERADWLLEGLERGYMGRGGLGLGGHGMGGFEMGGRMHGGRMQGGRGMMGVPGLKWQSPATAPSVGTGG